MKDRLEWFSTEFRSISFFLTNLSEHDGVQPMKTSLICCGDRTFDNLGTNKSP